MSPRRFPLPPTQQKNRTVLVHNWTLSPPYTFSLPSLSPLNKKSTKELLIFYRLKLNGNPVYYEHRTEYVLSSGAKRAQRFFFLVRHFYRKRKRTVSVAGDSVPLGFCPYGELYKLLLTAPSFEVRFMISFDCIGFSEDYHFNIFIIVFMWAFYFESFQGFWFALHKRCSSPFNEPDTMYTTLVVSHFSQCRI